MVLVAGIDSSTQSCKIVIKDAQTGETVRSGRSLHPSGTEVDPEAWWVALQEAVENAGGIRDVASVSIAGQQHGLVLLNAEGHVLRKAILWNDTRSAPEANELIEYFGSASLSAWTGSVPVASFTSTKLRWVLKNEPEIVPSIAAVCLPHDWLSWRLAGYGPAGTSQLGPNLNALCTDASDASGTGYFNPSTGQYITDILDFVIGKSVILPRIVQRGEYAYQPNPENSITSAGIAGGAGDNAAAALGLGVELGDVVVSIGTSGTVFSVSDTCTHDDSGTIAGFASACGRYLPLVCTLNAAKVLDSFCGLLCVSHDELSQLALQATPGSDGIVLIPYFEGERTPNAPLAKASIHGLTLANNTRHNLARAAVEGLVCGLADGLAALIDAGVECNRIILIGGGAGSEAVQQVAGLVFGLPVVVPHIDEYVSNGAARQAAWAYLKACPQWKIETLAVINSQADHSILRNYRAVKCSLGFS